MGETILDGRGGGYLAGVTSGNRLLVDISGATINIGSVSANVDSVYVQSGANLTGSMIEWEVPPTDNLKNNPSWKIQYDSNNNVESVYQFIGTGSYVNTLTWEGYSGTSIGLGSRVISVSDWSVV